MVEGARIRNKVGHCIEMTNFYLMNRYSLKPVVFILFLSVQPGFASKWDELRTLLYNKEYFKLERILPYSLNQMETWQVLYLNSCLESVFNRPEASNLYIEKIFEDDEKKMSEEMKCYLLGIKMSNYAKLYQYKKAAEACELMLSNQYHLKPGTSGYSILKDTYLKMYQALAEVPTQTTFIKDDSKIQLKMDRNKAWNIPVIFGSDTDNFLFDTGSYLSVISESLAAKIGIKKMGEFKSYYINGKKGTSSVGVLSSLKIGNAEVNNVVFEIVSDKDLSFRLSRYKINGIIGFPVIQQLKEIRISQDGYLRIPKNASKKDIGNLCMDNFIPIIEIFTSKDTLDFQLDTGAERTFLFKDYFDKHQDSIKRNFKRGRKWMVGVGGIQSLVSTKVYKLKNFTLRIANKTATLKETDIWYKSQFATQGVNNGIYGNLGQDVIKQFNTMVLNFESMYMEFK